MFQPQDSTKTSKRHRKTRGNTIKHTARLLTIPLITVIGIVEAVPVMVSWSCWHLVQPATPPPLLTRQNTKEKNVGVVGGYTVQPCPHRYLFGASPISTAVCRERVGGSITRKSNQQNHEGNKQIFSWGKKAKFFGRVKKGNELTGAGRIFAVCTGIIQGILLSCP